MSKLNQQNDRASATPFNTETCFSSRARTGSFSFHVLGEPGGDNALYLEHDTGQGKSKYLFDCGAKCIEQLDLKDVQEIRSVFFSHLHIDHVAGFDQLMRCVYGRPEPMHFYGPEQTIDLLHHRLQGTLWNLTNGSPGSVIISEVADGMMTSAQFFVSDGYKCRHELGARTLQDGKIIDRPDLSVGVLELDHGTPSLGYVVREKPILQVDKDKLLQLNMNPGPWLRSLKDKAINDSERVFPDDAELTYGQLREKLLKETPGDSIAYLTDFELKADEMPAVAKSLEGIGTLVCENNYADEHQENARKHHHLTTSEVAELARVVSPEELIVIHLSRRYDESQWADILTDLRKDVPEAYFPEDWCQS